MEKSRAVTLFEMFENLEPIITETRMSFLGIFCYMSQIILSELKLISLLRTVRLGYCHLQVREYLSSDSLLASPSRILEHSKKEGG